MLEVRNVKVYDLEESVIACRNAKRLTPPEYTDEEFSESLNRAKDLVLASAASRNVKCHDNFLTGIRVSFDLKYPDYIAPQMLRYNFLDVVTSSSKMHMIMKMDFKTCCNRYVFPNTIKIMEEAVAYYNDWLLREPVKDIDGEWENERYRRFMEVISNCPLGIELFERCSTNYKQLQTIYHQRKNHKLKEDWGAFCDFIRSLPYAKEFITGEE